MVKIFLHLSKAEQKKRFLDRLDKPEKNWKFSGADLESRALWDAYQAAYERAINATATRHCPWYVLPADDKWFTRYLVSEAVLDALQRINPQFPELPPEQADKLPLYRRQLAQED